MLLIDQFCGDVAPTEGDCNAKEPPSGENRGENAAPPHGEIPAAVVTADIHQSVLNSTHAKSRILCVAFDSLYRLLPDIASVTPTEQTKSSVAHWQWNSLDFYRGIIVA